MAKMSEYAFVAAMLSTGLATLAYLLYAVSGLRAARLQTAGMTVPGGAMGFISGPRTAALGRYATMLGWLAVVALLASMAFRTVATGHGPFANMYEFSMAFAFGILATYMWFERRYHQRILALVALPVALAMMGYAATIPADIEPLVPALQNNLLLTVHVAVAIVAYGSFSIAFAASLLYLIQPEGGRWGLPKPQILDEIGYRAVVVGFPVPDADDHPGRGLGGHGVGQLLELGSEGNRVAGDVADLRRLPPRTRDARLARQPRGMAAGSRLRGNAVHLLREPVLRRAPQLLGPGLTPGHRRSERDERSRHQRPPRRAPCGATPDRRRHRGDGRGHRRDRVRRGWFGE